jgi:putative FmdB family regulatory protein
MPYYEFRCKSCDAVFEERRTMAEVNAPATCPSGHVGAVRLLPVFATTGSTSDSGEQGADYGSTMPSGCGGACACHPG